MTVLLTRTPQADQRMADQRIQLEHQARHHEASAKDAAERGDFETAARRILALLDCERRQAAQGPQVLQVIKPRPAAQAAAWPAQPARTGELT